MFVFFVDNGSCFCIFSSTNRFRVRFCKVNINSNSEFYQLETKLKKLSFHSAHADEGPRSWVCACQTLCSAPHRRERKFSAARVCRIAFIHLPQLLRTHIQSFRKFQKFQKKNFKKPLKTPPSWARGGPQCFWGVYISFFGQYKHLVKFRKSS